MGDIICDDASSDNVERLHFFDYRGDSQYKIMQCTERDACQGA